MVIANEKLISKVVHLCFEVHKYLGPGLLESVYQRALAFELQNANLKFTSEATIEIKYKNLVLPSAFRADIIVENSLLIELKAIECLEPIHLAQTLTYLRMLDYKRGLLINFNQTRLKDGLKRVSI